MKAVLFDLGGTLVKTAPPPRVFRRILRSHGIQKPLADISSAFKKVERQQSIDDYQLPYEEFWRTYNTRILELLQVDGDFGKLADTITDEWWDNADLTLFPDAKETLLMLKERGLKVGLVTNGLQKDIDDILSRTGLTDIFDVTVGADAVRKPKPEKEIFAYAINKLVVRTQEALFVGDNAKTDYEGSRKAGLKPILIDRNNEVKKRIRKIRDLRGVMAFI